MAPTAQTTTETGNTGPVIFLMGPTGSGKSALGMVLAERFGLEIVNTDSVQLYRGLEIGSAKPGAAERLRVRHHLLDLTTPDDPFSVGRFRTLALECLEACHARGVVPILVGGTGLYFRAVERGLSAIPPVDPEHRKSLLAEGEALGWLRLHTRLGGVDPEAARRIAPNDAQRLVRALAVFDSSGVPLSEWHRRGSPPPTFPLLKLALLPEREGLYARIDRRFEAMLAAGLLAEVAHLAAQGFARELPAMKAVGYRQLLRHLDGQLSLEEAVILAKRDSRRYAKRQITWLRHEPGIVFLTGPDPAAEAGTRVTRFLAHHSHGSR
ncbi:MAG: tRNA (adenosine(37)-N6)-dimethylallyltransferase MiaA [Magnetococcales bacterium]|nr:tRNA (adenosine(37)-N6)-dimethylallyltransferase MiaA [Magnetococcales bacterium]